MSAILCHYHLSELSSALLSQANQPPRQCLGLIFPCSTGHLHNLTSRTTFRSSEAVPLLSELEELLHLEGGGDQYATAEVE